MRPALARAIIPPAGGNPMQRGMIRPMAPRGVYHGHGATPERLAPAFTREILPALRPTAPERAQHDCRVLVQGRAAHRQDRQDEVPSDDALLGSLAHWTAPVVDVDFGAPSAQRRCTAHCHQRLPLATVLAAVLDIAHLLRVATRQHLGHQAIRGGGLVARMGVLQRAPVMGKALLEDVPVPRGLGHHGVALSAGDTSVAVKGFSHGSPASCTPHQPLLRPSHPPRSPWNHEDFRTAEKCIFLYDQESQRCVLVQIHRCPPGAVGSPGEAQEV
jgi:hypothetical protein